MSRGSVPIFYALSYENVQTALRIIERSQHNSNTYNNWFIDCVFVIVPIQALAGKIPQEQDERDGR